MDDAAYVLQLVYYQRVDKGRRVRQSKCTTVVVEGKVRLLIDDLGKCN